MSQPTLVQFDADPQQTTLKDLTPGVQILATLRIEAMVDLVALEGKEKVASYIGNEIIELLTEGKSLINVIDPTKYINQLCNDVIDELDAKKD
jgi:hypothetical protein